jgi:hypothetical protein
MYFSFESLLIRAYYSPLPLIKDVLQLVPIIYCLKPVLVASSEPWEERLRLTALCISYFILLVS